LTRCCTCTGKFVTRKQDAAHGAVCGSCQPPSRAGKSAKAVSRVTEGEVAAECSTVHSEAMEESHSALSGRANLEPAQHEASCGQAA
jgi:flagellar transcriptional activator FlhC